MRRLRRRSPCWQHALRPRPTAALVHTRTGRSSIRHVPPSRRTSSPGLPRAKSGNRAEPPWSRRLRRPHSPGPKGATQMARRVRRSGLTMPINTPRFVNRSWTRNCDYLNFDFEDSVPQSQKAYARTLVAHAIAQGLKGGADITIRINCAYPEADVPAAVLPGVIQINFPKAETAEQMRALDRLITEAERVQGIRPGTVRIGANIETTLGVANSYEIASASPRIDTFSGGTGYDMSMDMGVEMFVGFDQFVYNRGEGALVAKALGLEYTGSVYLPDTSGNVGDRELTRRRAEANRKAGLRAGGGLHPNTVEPQNVGLTPTPEEVQEAQRVLDYFTQLDEQGEVEGELDGRLVDKYEAARAAELLEWSALCAQKDAYKAKMQAQTKALEASA